MISEKIDDPTKDFIRLHLPEGLRDGTRQVRSILAAALANVASWDWPETWPHLVPNLLDALNSNDINTIDGALRCLKAWMQNCKSGKVFFVYNELKNLSIIF